MGKEESINVSIGIADNEPMTVLIVGASGFLGSKLFAELSKRYRVIGTYYSRPARDLVFLDTSDRNQVAALFQTIRPDILIDCGGMTRPDECERDPKRAYQVNVEGATNLVDFCNCKVIYFSTDYVFDGKKGRYTESDQPCPVNYYGWTKQEAEKIVLGARPDNVVIRVAGLYGDSARNNEFLSSFSKPVIYRAVDCFSSSLLLDDLVQYLSFFWGASGLYHFTDRSTMSRYEFAVKAVQILGLRVKVIGLPASEIYQSAQRPRDSSLISIRHNLPVRNVEEGLWYLRHRINEFYRNESFCQEIGMEPTKGVKGPIFWLPWGLIPAVIQDYETGEVLMVGYMNHEAWELTLREGRMHYYSRKKRRIWLKGEQSGHYQFVKEVFLNCDNTCLLFKVEQVGGACDLGLRSCFDKVLKGEEFESTGVKVFDPQDVYGERFTQEIRLGIPSGSLEAMTFTLLELAGYEVERESPRSYHPRVINDPDLKLFMARAQELPIIVEQSFLDAAITGLDWVKETGASIRDICDLGYNKSGLGSVALVLAVSDRVALNSLKELEGKRVATTYPNLTRQFFSDRGISITIITSAGATEGKVPFLADAVVELVETGETLRANHLKPILKLCETSAHLIANNESWGYTWKRRRLEEIADRMTSAAGKLPQNPKRKIELPTSEASL